MYQDINQVKRANDRAGKYFFSPATMRFFRSRLGGQIYGGRYFVTSEQFDAKSPRLYTIRMATDDGDIKTIGEFQQYGTYMAAKRAIDKLIKGEVK